MLFALALFAPADAAELTLYRKGPIPVRAWVDGQPLGKIKNQKKATVTEVEPGVHEVWFAGEDTGTVTLCHGIVDVKESAEVYLGIGAQNFRCNGLQPGWPDGPSAFKGAFVQFTVDAGDGKWVSIDGGQKFAFPSMPFELNLAPGPHTIVLYDDVHGEFVFDQGMVTLAAGQRLPVTCTPAGCMGFDAPPVVIVEIREAPHIQLSTPGVHIEIGL